MAITIEQIAARVESLKYRASERDARAGDVLSVRQGNISQVYPDFFPEGVDANVVANFIDIVARDLSEVMAPLPAVNCSSASQTNDRARRFADNRTRIASNYFNHSDLQVSMYTGADYYVTYGFVPFIIELDDEAKMPRIRVENPRMAYPEFDRYGRCISFVLRNRFAMLAMEAAEKSVQSPIVVPMDVQELQLGGDSVIRTNTPGGVRRVELNIPQGAFTEQNLLNQELRIGARYPEGRTGNVNASIVTGQGVQALMGAFDTQVKSAQAIFASALRDVIGLCFEIDESIFDIQKTIRGVDAGSPYALEYKPSKDIKGDYSADVRYGMLAGLNPAQGLIFMLQALGGKLISKDMAMRELPFNVNVSQEQEKIEIEDMRNALISSLQAYTQAIPQMAAQGQDPSDIVTKIANVIKSRQKGQSIEDAIEQTFAPKEQVPPAGAPMVEQPSPAPAAPVGGLPPMEAEGQGVPDVQSLLSSLTSGGAANASVRTIRRR